MQERSGAKHGAERRRRRRSSAKHLERREVGFGCLKLLFR
jgi:hypothetical protein